MGECAPPAAAPAPTTAKTSVWWDIDKCAVPRGRCDPHRIAHNLIAALAAAGYAGPVSIAAYGDAARVPPPVLAALSATGICLNHVPAGSKDTSEKRMLVDMLFWAFDNPPPGNYLLISGDQDLSDLLHRLRMKRYDILLVRPPNASSQALAAAAKKVWLWENLTAGELLLPEPPPARSVLGCKLNVNSSGTLSLGYKLNANGTDAMKCSQSKVCSEYGKGDINGKTGGNKGEAVNRPGVKPLQKYVKKTKVASCSANKQAQKPVASAHLHEVKAPHESILGKKPRTPVEQVKAHESILGFDKSISSLGFNTSSYVNQSTDPQSSQPPCGNNCRAVHQPYNPPNSPEIEGIIGIILHALGTLKTEKIFPTESNIADCICYGEMNLTAFDVKKALELAIRHETVVMKKLLHDMPLFVAKDESLWKCVNVTNSKAKNPIEELETVYNYMSSTDGYSAIKNSQSRYQAATILKRSCLQHFSLGDVLQVLHILVVRKKWIVPHSSGWQPVSINTTAYTTDATGKVKS
nr:unnamed protein product [Digitaria exilis]